MKLSTILSFGLAAAAAAAPACALKKDSKHLQRAEMVEARAASLPDVVNVKVKNLYPEDGVWDFSQQTLYQSNLWKGLISTFKPSDGSHINVRIDGVVSEVGTDFGNGNGRDERPATALVLVRWNGMLMYITHLCRATL